MEITLEHRPDRSENEPWFIYRWSIYPKHSVLAGQDCKKFVQSYKTKDEALAAYPDATDNGYRDAHNYYDHLPDHGDLY
jgi:hypothetical protein